VSSASIEVLYFAWLREKIGVEREQVALPDGTVTMGDVLLLLRQRHAALDVAFRDAAVLRFAVNRQFAKPDTPVSAGDEVAIFPPVTGG